jgi:selenocysteine lyase/cysteine desulfurase
MPISRKAFLRHAAAFAATAAGSLSALAARPSLPEAGAARNEDYWKAIRANFPLSANWAYLNTGTVGPSPYPVINATHAGMMETDLYGHYEGYLDAAKKLAAFVGADESEIALTHNTTEGINIACWGLPLKRGDEVIVTTQEHVGNAFPWLNRQRLHGIELRAVAPAATAAATLERVAALITKKTRAIAVPHVPCTQGQVLPLKEICDLARSKGIYTVIDGAHGPGMLPLDLHAIGCDAYAGCCHKWLLGPKGTGFLYVRKAFQETLQPYFVGAGGETGVWNMATTPIKTTEYFDTAHRYYGGTQNLGLWRGVEAAVDFMEHIGMENVHRRCCDLTRHLRDGLQGYGDRIELLTPGEDCSQAGITSFRIRKMDHFAFFARCIEYKIRIRSVPENGLNAVRVSTHIFNSTAELDRILELVGKVV